MGWAAVVMVVEGRRSLWRPEEEELSGKCVRARVRSIVRPTDAAALSGRKKRESERGGGKDGGLSLSLFLSRRRPTTKHASLPPFVRSFVRPAVSYNRLSSLLFPSFRPPQHPPLLLLLFSGGRATDERGRRVCEREKEGK